MRRISGPKREEVTGGCKQTQKNELHSSYISQNIIRIIKPKRIKWAENVAHMAKMRNAYGILIRNSEWQR